MPGWRCRSITSWVLPNWMIAVVLPGAGRPGQDQPATGAEGVPVEQGQPAAGVHDLPQRRGRDHPQPGVVVQPSLVIADPVGLGQTHPLSCGQQRRRGRRIGDELPPALQGGQVLVQILLVERVAPCGVVDGGRVAAGAGHHRLCASWNGSNTPSGMTLATGDSPSSWSSSSWSWLLGWSTSSPSSASGGPGAADRRLAFARVRAATLRFSPVTEVLGSPPRSGPWLTVSSSAATAAATSSSPGVPPWSASCRRAWFQARSPNGTGAVPRWRQGTVIQPPCQWLRTQMRVTS